MSFGVLLDMSMDSMEETRFKKKHSKLIHRLSKTLHLTYTELECLFLIYYKIQKDGPEKQPAMNKVQFRDVLHKGLDMTDDSLMERIFMTFQKGSAQYVSLEVWAKFFSLFLYGTLQEKIDFCFSVYDMAGNGKITRDILLNLLRHSLISQSGDDDLEDVKDMVEIINKKMDQNRDGKISYQDYKKTVLQQPQMLEALGQCLPSRLAVHAFITTFTSRVPRV